MPIDLNLNNFHMLTVYCFQMLLTCSCSDTIYRSKRIATCVHCFLVGCYYRNVMVTLYGFNAKDCGGMEIIAKNCNAHEINI